MKPGEIVMVYEDPITQQRPEGEAVLVKPISQDDYDRRNRLERWRVQFVGESDTYERVIATGVTA